MRKRWMAFVDGENLAIRAKNLDQTQHDFALIEGRYYQRDVYVWYPQGKSIFSHFYGGQQHQLQPHAIRTYYYTSVTGDETLTTDIEQRLWEMDFQARVFKKPQKSMKAKAVDIALATDFLSNAFHDNYDVAYLVAGDGDYQPMVEEAKRLGKIVYVSFFEGNGYSPKLKRAADCAFDLTDPFTKAWRGYRDDLAAEAARTASA